MKRCKRGCLVPKASGQPSVEAGKDTEHQGYEGQQGHAEPEVGQVVLPLGFGQSVRQRWLQAHKQHTGGKGNACSDIVENFGIIHLWYRDREQEEKVREPFKGLTQRHNTK